MNTVQLEQIFALLDTLPNPVTLNEAAIDENGETYDKIIYVNKSFLRTIGYTTEDIPDDRTWFTKAYPDPTYQLHVTSEWFKEVERSKSTNSDLLGFPAQVSCKDGEARWFNVTTQLTHSIEEKYRTIVFMQIDSPQETQLKLDEKNIERIKERHLFKTIIDSAPIRIFWKDRNGVYLGANRAFLDDAKLAQEQDIIGKTDFEMVWKELASLYQKDDKEVLESGMSKLNYIEHLYSIDEPEKIVSTSKVPLIDTAGQTIGVLGLYQDITQEVWAQEKLQEQEKLLIVQSKQAAMGEMISMIAHQWRQPLTSISAIVTNLKLKKLLETLTCEEVDSKFNSVEEQVTYLDQTIDDFRNFFKPDKSKERVTIEEVLINVFKVIDQLLRHNSINIIKNYQSVVSFITFHKELQQVFINIIKNAADVLCENRESQREIYLTTFDTDTNITIEICDNGGGIPQAIQERIFEPYFSTKENKNGTGLGLYMSKTIIENHLGGSLSCKNRQDGACFTITIPYTS